MAKKQSTELLQAYYHAFNQQDMAPFFDLLDDQVIHEINQGEAQVGKAVFREFMDRMNACYRETIKDLVVFVNEEGTRGAAEFVVDGCYLKTDEGLPPASNQTYSLKGGAFFDIDSGKITRISNYYNLNEWLKQIDG